MGHSPAACSASAQPATSTEAAAWPWTQPFPTPTGRQGPAGPFPAPGATASSACSSGWTAEPAVPAAPGSSLAQARAPLRCHFVEHVGSSSVAVPVTSLSMCPMWRCAAFSEGSCPLPHWPIPRWPPCGVSGATQGQLHLHSSPQPLQCFLTGRSLSLPSRVPGWALATLPSPRVCDSYIKFHSLYLPPVLCLHCGLYVLS